MMSNRYFFIATSDSVSGALISLALNEHPDIYCHVSFADPLLQTNDFKNKRNARKMIDEFVTTKALTHTAFNGNTQLFSAYELQHRIIAERVTHPIKKITLAVAPENRIQFLVKSWLDEYHTPANAVKNLEINIKEIAANTESSTFDYKFNYFYNWVCDAAKQHTLGDEGRLFLIALAKVLAYDSADLPVPSKTFVFEKLITDINEFKQALLYLTDNTVDINQTDIDKISVQLQQIQTIVKNINVISWQPWMYDLLNTCLNSQLESVHYPFINKTLNELYAELGMDGYQSSQKNSPYSKLISIQLNSNRPAQLAAYFDNIEETADHPEEIEVLVNYDIGDTAMEQLLSNEAQKRKFTIKYICSERPASFCDLWKPINKLLEITDPNSYFLLNISDEMLFATQGWDSILKRYVGFFPDHIFRLRASRNKLRNYFDRWECSFAQDSIPITTKRWVDIGGDWNPCFGPDSFQQLVAFYLAQEGSFAFTNYLREMPVIDIKFHGDTPAVGTDRDKEWKRINEHIKAMEICQSHRMQTEARRRAVKLKAHIIAHTKQLEKFKLIDDRRAQKIRLFDQHNQLIMAMPYRLSKFKIGFTNLWRKPFFHAYFGDGKATRHIIKSPLKYFKARSQLLQKVYTNLLRMRHKSHSNALEISTQKPQLNGE